MDELHALRSVYTETTAPVPDAVAASARAALDAHVVASQVRRPPRRRRFRTVGVIAASAVLAAAGWGVLVDSPRSALTFRCVAGSNSAILANDGSAPVEACAQEWAAGRMVEGTTEAPPLVACVDGTASVAVITGADADACEEAGMRLWEDQERYRDVGNVVREARVAFHARFDETGDGCATDADWEEQLSSLHDGWALSFDRGGDGRRCFDLASIDLPTNTLRFVGVPGSFSIGCDPRSGC